MSAIFSLLTATERLENMWARRGAITPHDYELQCSELLQQYAALRDTAGSINLDRFIAEYDIKANKARPRVLSGVPGTLGRGGGRREEQGSLVLKSSNLFHSISNCLDMKQHEVGILLPMVISLIKMLGRITTLHGKDFEFLDELRGWVQKLNALPSTDSLDEEEASRFRIQLDVGYNEFENIIADS